MAFLAASNVGGGYIGIRVRYAGITKCQCRVGNIVVEMNVATRWQFRAGAFMREQCAFGDVAIDLAIDRRVEAETVASQGVVASAEVRECAQTRVAVNVGLCRTVVLRDIETLLIQTSIVRVRQAILGNGKLKPDVEEATVRCAGETGEYQAQITGVDILIVDRLVRIANAT